MSGSASKMSLRIRSSASTRQSPLGVAMPAPY
jgi:hypothetical protein